MSLFLRIHFWKCALAEVNPSLSNADPSFVILYDKHTTRLNFCQIPLCLAPYGLHADTPTHTHFHRCTCLLQSRLRPSPSGLLHTEECPLGVLHLVHIPLQHPGLLRLDQHYWLYWHPGTCQMLQLQRQRIDGHFMAAAAAAAGQRWWWWEF